MQFSDMANFSTKEETVTVKETWDVHNESSMTWFQAFRGEFGYSNFGEYRTSVTADIQFVIIIYTCVLISVATLIVAAGIRGKESSQMVLFRVTSNNYVIRDTDKNHLGTPNFLILFHFYFLKTSFDSIERWYTLIRVVYSLAVGTIILVSIHGYCWQIGHVNIRSPYIYRNEGQVEATLGIRVGLRTINLTLSGQFMDSRNVFNYNEEYELEKVLKSPVQMSEALSRGLPSPLLFIIEHYDTDDGEFRFGRGCFMSGYFANILLWAAFVSWVIGTILLCSVIWYGAVLYILTGICMLLAAIIYDILCTDHYIKVPCNDRVLRLSYGWCFWSTLVFGILNTVIGLVVFTLENKVPKMMAIFFQLDTPFEDNEEQKIFLTPPSRSPTVPNTPVPSIRVDKDSTLKAPMNWYLNYGYDGSKANPVFTETGNDRPVTPTGNDVTKSHDIQNSRSRFGQIQEEDHKSVKYAEKISNNNRESSQKDETIDRLNEIYVDVEPPHRKESAVNHMFIQELDAAIEGK